MGDSYGPGSAGHQPSPDGLLPAFDGNTKPQEGQTPIFAVDFGTVVFCVRFARSRRYPGPAAETGTLTIEGEAIMTDRGVTIVTGGASGIGLAIAKALLGEGWKVII